MPARRRTPKLPAARAAVRQPRARANQPPPFDSIITMNAGGVIQSASDSVEQVFGWTPAELFGRNVKVLVPEPRRSALDRYLDRYRRADAPAQLQRTRRFAAVRKDGKPIEIELSVSRADLPAYDAPYFIGIVRDVSQQIDVGDDPGERRRLHQLITEQTRALATANLRLQLTDRMASLGTLAAGLGHDMNNVLLPVRARLNALEHSGITSAAQGHLKAVRRSIAYLQHLSDGLHFLALNPDAPRTVSDTDDSTNLSYWWSQVGVLLRKMVPKHVTLDASIPPRLPSVTIAPHWLTQAMLNLIVNAGESIPTGRRGGRVRLRAAMSQDGATVRLSVTDNGRGMAPEVQNRAFDLFFTTKSRRMGTGLGLPLVRKVAVRSGGSVELHSEPGRGTTAVLVLPVTHRNGAGRTTSETRSATISVQDHRTAALISQILIGAGVRVRPDKGEGPGRSEVWVTEPSASSLRAALRWRARKASRSVVVLGMPPKNARKKWAALGATIIDPPDDFEAMRHALQPDSGAPIPVAASEKAK